MKIITKTSLLLFTISFCAIKADAQLASAQPATQPAPQVKSVPVANAAPVKLASDLSPVATAKPNDKAQAAKTAEMINKSQQLTSGQGTEPAVKPKPVKPTVTTAAPTQQQ